MTFMQWNEFRTDLQYLSEKDLKDIERAFELGKLLHEGQMRKSGEPYFTHPIAVARLLATWKADKDTIIAALLHDTIEDTEATLATIKKEFGPAVETLVDGVTKLNYQDLDGSPSLNERVETLRKMFTLMQEDVRMMVIKLADRLHNMQTIEFRSPNKQKTVAQETLDIYVKIADRLSMFDVSDELESLCLAVLEKDLFQRMQDFREKNQEKSSQMATLVEKMLQETHPVTLENVIVSAEPRTWKKLRRHLQAEEGPVHNVAGAAISLVCKDIDACYLVLGALHQLWQRETLSFQDYINSPQLNGYQGLHTTIILDDGLRVRCKIRTEAMHVYAHKGITTRCFDAESKGLFEYLPWAKRISPLSKDSEDRSDEFWRSLQNDILGDAILIHGQGAHVQLLPTHSHAIDAVFYLYGERGLFTDEIYVDDQRVPFYEELTQTCTVYAKFSDTQKVTLEWLDQTRTGLAAAYIRNALSAHDRSNKIVLGQKLLEEYFHEHRRGFISELDPHSIEMALRDQKHSSLEAIYEQIAEGRMSVEEAEGVLFRRNVSKAKESDMKKHVYALTCEVPGHLKQAVWDLLQYYYVQSLDTVEENAGYTMKIAVSLNEEELRTLMLALDHRIPKRYNLVRTSARYHRFLLTGLLFILWGVDPAVTYKLLDVTGASPFDMTILFFMTTTTLSGGLLLWVRAHRIVPEARLSLKNRSLWLSAILLFLVILTTYTAMQDTLPSHYTIPMTAAGLLLTSIVNRKHVAVLATTWLTVIAGIFWILMATPSWHWIAIFFTTLSIIVFTGFTLVSENYKRKEHVSLRAAQYFFLLSIVGMALCIPLFAFSTIMGLSLKHIVLIVLSVVLISGLPYYIYYFLLSRKEIDVVLRYSFLIIPGTFISELLIVSTPSWHTLGAAAIVTLGAFFPIAYFKRMRQKQTLEATSG